MLFKIEISGTLRDRHGKIVQRIPWQKANSALIQFVRLLLIGLSQATWSVNRASGILEDQPAAATLLRTNAADNVKTHGILIGTGDIPVTISDFALEILATTNISYSAHTYGAEQPTSNSYRCTISRTFTNNTGAVLNIKEVGLAVLPTSGTSYYLIDRTLLTISVPNGMTQTLVYRITISI